MTKGANIVEDFYIGNTRIKIADDYCCQSPKEMNLILSKIASCVFGCLAKSEKEKNPSYHE